jgi:hypothetical protein
MRHADSGPGAGAHGTHTRRCLVPLVLVALVLVVSSRARADAGPPFLTNDPGTPGNANWEINLSAAQSVSRDGAAYQLPQIDMNFGVGDRVQLTAEVPYEVATSVGGPAESGWSNAFLGVKWRFLDQGESGWQISTFPQYESGLSLAAQLHGLGGPGPRVLLPVEFAHNLGTFTVNFEAGGYVPFHGPSERILGLVVGHALSSKLELDVELYDDRIHDEPSPQTTLDLGGRYELRPGILALFMAGRGLGGLGEQRPQFIGFAGVQILLSDYGRRLRTQP